ncbi:GAS2-like protein pickled eggs [Drosophila innubila]|uniref:GAS2-like protein pickled eggs n=1 Tax=Drosophila innubila TaxID=198719 RepID=UPI00148BDBE8|nr:GAS2-like protein pickled eggs [Drosophila innubila]XP_034490189.1 GAS2-like protein pickled eggs [Drosophila innubila]
MAMLEARPYRPFKSSEEYLEAMKEDLAEWLSTLYPELSINAENFMDRLDTGVALCKHANYVRQAAEGYLARRQARNKSMTRSMTSGLAGPILALGNVHYLPAAKSGTFFSRDNVSNFITWCRKSLKIIECLLFETDDLIMRKNEKHVILCLLEVARRGAKFGMLAPMLVQMERQIDREIAADNKANGVGCGTQTSNGCAESGTQTEAPPAGSECVAVETDLYDSDTENEDENDKDPMLMYGPQPQIVTNDLKSLDEMVRDLVEKCTCPSQFPMVRVSEGKYRIGDTKVLIFVRILRSHVMVRVGGGWDTLSHYLDKHDPCRCRAQHRVSITARLMPRNGNSSSNSQSGNGGIELHNAQVIYERSPHAPRRVMPTVGMAAGTGSGTATGSASPTAGTVGTLGVGTVNASLSPSAIAGIAGKHRSRSPTPQRKFLNQTNNGNSSNMEPLPGSPHLTRRSMSPTQRRLISDMRKKQNSMESKSLPNAEETAGAGAGTGTGAQPEQSSKFENISDNGSEISDEGYRSLGVIQSTAQKRESLHSQASIEDAESNARLDQTSSDSQISPTDEPEPEQEQEQEKSNHSLKKHEKEQEHEQEQEDEIYAVCEIDGPQSLPAVLALPKQSKLLQQASYVDHNKFEQSGVFITDDEITVTTESVQPAGNKMPGQVQTVTPAGSKIPRSPLAQRRRRSSIDNSTCSGAGGSLQDLSTRSGSLPLNRKQPVYRSGRRPTAPTVPGATGAGVSRGKASQLPLVRDVTNTWSGRSAATAVPTKKRPTINTDTFAPPATTSTSPSAFDRSVKTRSSQILYDSNGRRVRGCTSSLTTSPVKNHASSPLAQQLLEAASSAKNDAQILEKMKTLLSRYAAGNQQQRPVSAGAGTAAGPGNGKKTPVVYEDFTTAWVHTNGNPERSESCSPPAKARSKRSSAASSCGSNHSAAGAGASNVISPRRERGMSKIPAPVRHHTELY